jgi:hypothetical protein
MRYATRYAHRAPLDGMIAVEADITRSEHAGCHANRTAVSMNFGIELRGGGYVQKEAVLDDSWTAWYNEAFGKGNPSQRDRRGPISDLEKERRMVISGYIWVEINCPFLAGIGRAAPRLLLLLSCVNDRPPRMRRLRTDDNQLADERCAIKYDGGHVEDALTKLYDER